MEISVGYDDCPKHGYTPFSFYPDGDKFCLRCAQDKRDNRSKKPEFLKVRNPVCLVCFMEKANNGECSCIG